MFGLSLDCIFRPSVDWITFSTRGDFRFASETLSIFLVFDSILSPPSSTYLFWAGKSIGGEIGCYGHYFLFCLSRFSPPHLLCPHPLFPLQCTVVSCNVSSLSPNKLTTPLLQATLFSLIMSGLNASLFLSSFLNFWKNIYPLSEIDWKAFMIPSSSNINTKYICNHIIAATFNIAK